MDAVNNLPLVAAIVACQQLLAAVMIIFDDIPTRYEARMDKKRRIELAPYKRNVSQKVGPPETELEPFQVLDCRKFLLPCSYPFCTSRASRCL
jgi:hypothetical protein